MPQQIETSGKLVGQDILCFSSIDWDFNWQGHQEIMATLAKQGNRVLFVDNTGVRPPTRRDLPRLRQRMRNWWVGVKGFRQERDNLFVCSPLILPFPYSWVARWINRAILLRALRRWMRAIGFHLPVILTFLPTRLVVDLIDRLDSKLVIYYCVADFEQLSSRPQKIRKSERLLLNRTDIVFAQGEVFRQRCMPHPNVHIFPPGVNIQIFRPDIIPAPELLSLQTPIVGYVGGIHRYVDLDLLERIAVEIKGTVVLVGPVQTDVARLNKLSNVVFTGQMPHSRIPEFIRRFDVGIIPYLLTEYTKTVYPTKLNEYLAMGTPVVASDLPEIRRFNAEHGAAITVAKDTEAFVEAVREAAEHNSPGDVERRIKIAKHNSWETRIAHMSELIGATLTARQADTRLWEGALRRIYRAARRRVARAAVGIAVVCLLVFYSPFVWYVAEPLRVIEPPRRADAIVVFGGGVGESGVAGGGYQERVKQAMELYHEGKASRLVFSSGYVFVLREAEVMKELAVAHGVPISAILLEERAGNTYEYVRSVREILHRQGWRTILLVSSPYHMRRATWTFRKVAPEITVIPVPVPRSQFYAHERGASLEQIRGILHEYLAIVAYWWRGWI